MNRLRSSRNHRLKFATSGELPIILEEPIKYTSNEWKRNQKMSTCNRLDYRITVITARGEEPAVSCYGWTGWVREITGWSLLLSGELPIVLEESIEYTSNEWNQKMSTCNRLDLGSLLGKKNRWLVVTDEPVEFEKSPVQVRDFLENHPSS